METTEKKKDIYLGNLKTKKRKSGEEFLVGSICLDQLGDSLPEELIQPGTNGKHYLRVIIQKNLIEDKHGNTHCIKVDTFNPIVNYEKKDK